MPAVSYFFLIAALVAAAYQLVAVLAGLRHWLHREPPADWRPGVSILKPVRGLDPHFFRAIRSHALQQYPEFEILFGVADPDDPAIPDIERLIAEFPGVPIRLIHTRGEAPNRKTAVLAELAAQAKYPVLLVNDSDIRVPPGYLQTVVAPLASERTGMVTCLYRGAADSFPARFEALGVATDWASSVLVAPFVGVREFGLGSTLVFRAGQLREIGGFAAISAYLADDYQLTRRIVALGYRVHLSKTVVETTLSSSNWGEVWRHQLRWHRTIRVCRRTAYFGITVTQATLWGLLAIAAGWWPAGLAAIALRLAAGAVAGLGVLRCPITARLFWLIPLRDLFGVAVFLAGAAGRTVEWRGRLLHLTSDGRITGSTPRP